MKNMAPMRVGVLLALITLLYGFSLGAYFGWYEDNLKEGLRYRAMEVLSTVYHGDETRAAAVADKSWTYYKRSHMHAGGIGAAALILILLLGSFSANRIIKPAAASCLGAGGLGYSIFWLLAGSRAPAMGSTSAAKASLSWLAIPSAALCLLGVALLVGTFALLAFIGGPRTGQEDGPAHQEGQEH